MTYKFKKWNISKSLPLKKSSESNYNDQVVGRIMLPWMGCRWTMILRNESFPDRAFPDRTFPGRPSPTGSFPDPRSPTGPFPVRDVSRSRPFPTGTFPGRRHFPVWQKQQISMVDVSRSGLFPTRTFPGRAKTSIYAGPA